MIASYWLIDTLALTRSSIYRKLNKKPDIDDTRFFLTEDQSESHASYFEERFTSRF